MPGSSWARMYAAAFFESDPVKLVETALQAIPAECQYAEMVRDMVAWYRADPNDWEKTWQLCQKKYRENPDYQKASNGGIDCKINGAYVLLGLLYGQRDPDQTIIISMRGGQDSDCNPSSAAGVLFTTMGLANVPERFTKELNQTNIFSHTAYSFPRLIEVCEKLARQILMKAGGKIVRENGEEVFLIPVRAPQPSKLELSWAPGPDRRQPLHARRNGAITVGNVPAAYARRHRQVCPRLGNRQLRHGHGPGPARRVGRPRRTCWSRTRWSKADRLRAQPGRWRSPEGKKTKLRLVVAHDPQGDFDLVVRAGGKELLRKPVSKATCHRRPMARSGG